MTTPPNPKHAAEWKKYALTLIGWFILVLICRVFVEYVFFSGWAQNVFGCLKKKRQSLRPVGEQTGWLAGMFEGLAGVIPSNSKGISSKMELEASQPSGPTKPQHQTFSTRF